MIAQRMNHIDSSGIRKVFDLAKNMTNPVNLSIGQPDFDIPDDLKMEAIRWIESGFNQYTLTQGIQELREKILHFLKVKRSVEAEDIMITSGVSGGILLSFMALLDPGDEVIIPDPYFVMYKHLAKIIGAVPVFVDTYPDFILRAEAIEAKISPKTKLIIVNSPANPTGIVIPDEELKQIAHMAKHHNIPILSDEIYSSFIYDEKHYISIGKHNHQTLILDGFSKSHAMTGWRIGYAAGPHAIIQAMIKLQQFSFVCAPSISQKTALRALDYDMSSYITDYKQKRDLIYNGLADKYQVSKPQGAFYIFPKAPIDNADHFVKKAIENNLLIIPGNVFSEKNSHFRISFAASNETIIRGIEILNKMA